MSLADAGDQLGVLGLIGAVVRSAVPPCLPPLRLDRPTTEESNVRLAFAAEENLLDPVVRAIGVSIEREAADAAGILVLDAEVVVDLTELGIRAQPAARPGRGLAADARRSPS